MKKELRSLKQAKARIIFISVWMIIAIVCLIVGLQMFLSDEERGFGSWVMCGVACCFPVIGTVLRIAISNAKQGWKQGANEYTATVTDTHVTVSNHPFRQAILSFIVAVAISLVAGPIILGFSMILNVISLIQAILYVKNNKPAPQNNELSE